MRKLPAQSAQVLGVFVEARQQAFEAARQGADLIRAGGFRHVETNFSIAAHGGIGGVAQASAASRVLKRVLVPAVLSGREVPVRRRAKRNGRGIVRYAERMLSLDDRSPAR